MIATQKVGRDSSRAIASYPQMLKRAWMHVLTLDAWDIADHSLQWIGRGATWVILGRRSTRDETALCAATGGALLWEAFGGVFGFALSNLSQDISVIGGTLLGGLLGACIGFCFGAFVEIVDSTIKDQLKSLNLK